MSILAKRPIDDLFSIEVSGLGDGSVHSLPVVEGVVLAKRETCLDNTTFSAVCFSSAVMLSFTSIWEVPAADRTTADLPSVSDD